MALQRKRIPSPFFSSRGSAKVRLIVLHTTEGARTYQDLGAFFQRNRVSSHVGIDDTRGVIGEYVGRQFSAWTSASANPVAVQAELCAFARWSRAEWMKHPRMLENTAAWIAEESKALGIPITKLSSSQAQGSGRGVCQHNDLGAWGGGHWDCGPGFPMDLVLDMARGGSVDELGYPDWFWPWVSWYLTTERDNKKRPKGVPATIPKWAWDGLQAIEKIGARFGMTVDERHWLDWYLAGREGQRPDVPQTIPERWWHDQEWIAKR
jgi:hypothetical protein